MKMKNIFIVYVILFLGICLIAEKIIVAADFKDIGKDTTTAVKDVKEQKSKGPTQDSITPQVLAAIIGGIATIIATILGKIPYDILISRIFRKSNNIPDITKSRWDSNWYLGDNTEYVHDRVEFKKWKKENQFSGSGDMLDNSTPPKQYIYPITGEISPQGIVILTYKAEKYPTESLIGMACMELSPNAQELHGYWAGRGTQKNQNGEEYQTIIGGKVKMRRSN